MKLNSKDLHVRTEEADLIWADELMRMHNLGLLINTILFLSSYWNLAAKFKSFNRPIGGAFIVVISVLSKCVSRKVLSIDFLSIDFDCNYGFDWASVLLTWA